MSLTKILAGFVDTSMREAGYGRSNEDPWECEKAGHNRAALDRLAHDDSWVVKSAAEEPAAVAIKYLFITRGIPGTTAPIRVHLIDDIVTTLGG